MSDIEPTEGQNVSPEAAAIAQASMNELATRANELASRMQSLGMPADVTIVRGSGPGGNFSTTVAMKISIHAQIALYEVLCDILEARERNPQQPMSRE